MHSIRKLFFFSLLFSLLSFLPVSASQLKANSDLEPKTNLRLNSITSPMVDDFLVNDDSGSSNQLYPTIAVDSSCNFTISWEDSRNGNRDIYFQRYSASGIPLGPNVKANDDTGSRWQEFPSVSANAAGDLVLTWNDTRDVTWDIYFQRYASDGTPINSNIKVNSTTVGWRWRPEITSDKSGNYTITWYSDYNGDNDIFAQRYDTSGSPLSPNFRVDDDTGTTRQSYPSIKSTGTGGFIITWTDHRYGDPDIYAQRYDSASTPLGSNFRVNDDNGSGYQGHPAIASDALGNFVITWEDARNGNDDIYAQRYTSVGALISSNFRVNDDSGASGQSVPVTAVVASGNIIVAWIDSRNGNYDIYAQRYNSSGTAIGENFAINSSQSKVFAQIYPAVVANNSNIVFTWLDNRRGNGWDVYAKVVNWSWGTPHIVLNPGILNFIATQKGAIPPAQSFTILNHNGGTFNWTLSHKDTWLDISPDSGFGDSTIVTVNVNRTDSLPFANYDTIVVSSPGADNSPQMIPVNYYLSPSPSGPDPGIPDTVSVERVATVPPNTHLPPIYVYLFNDEPLAAYAVPLAFPDSIYDYDIRCDSVSFADTRTDFVALDVYPVVDNDRNLIFIPAIWFAGQLEPGNGNAEIGQGAIVGSFGLQQRGLGVQHIGNGTRAQVIFQDLDAQALPGLLHGFFRGLHPLTSGPDIKDRSFHLLPHLQVQLAQPFLGRSQGGEFFFDLGGDQPAIKQGHGQGHADLAVIVVPWSPVPGQIAPTPPVVKHT